MNTVSDDWYVTGGNALLGEVEIQTSKNSILPILAGSLLAQKGQTVVRKVPEIDDVKIAVELLRSTGAKVDYDLIGKTISIDSSTVDNGRLDPSLTSRFRGSVLFLGALIQRLGYVELQGIGGCSIGDRNIDFHLRGFKRLGVKVETEDNRVVLELNFSRLHSNILYLDTPSHTGTENLLMGAVLAEGDSIIENSAKDPEVVDFGNFLIKLGARITGLGTSRIYVNGVPELHSCDYTPISDRLAAGTFMIACAITNGEIAILNANPDHLMIFTEKLKQMGTSIKIYNDSTILVKRETKELSPINIITYPYPGFPTDLQPCITSLSTLATNCAGTSYIRETVFDGRFGFVEELIKMGANIEITKENKVIVHGVKSLKPAVVDIKDIRSGAALLIAALSIQGQTKLINGNLIRRGYERIDEALKEVGGIISCA